MRGDFYKTWGVTPCCLKLRICNIYWLLGDFHVPMVSQHSPFYLKLDEKFT